MDGSKSGSSVSGRFHRTGPSVFGWFHRMGLYMSDYMENHACNVHSMLALDLTGLAATFICNFFPFTSF